MNAKDFQKATIDRIIELFKIGQKRVLLADEVGLGKTIVANGVVSEFYDEVGNVDNSIVDDNKYRVIYICNNLNIASQNCAKLCIKTTIDSSSCRLSMLHLKLYQDNDFEQLIPLTPATSFSMTSGAGTASERTVLYTILREMPEFRLYKRRLSKLFCYNVGYWPVVEKQNEIYKLRDTSYISDMLENLRTPETLELVKETIDYFNNIIICDERKLINKFRLVFAKISLNMLSPDLVIMDEFQRFSSLLYSKGEENETGILANRFLDENSSTYTLLLSATPYKPFSTLEELVDGDEESHYSEFNNLMNYLIKDKTKIGEFKEVWRDYSYKLQQINEDNFAVVKISKTNAQNELYSTTCRTERTNNAIIGEINQNTKLKVTTPDILSHTYMQKLMNELDLGNLPIEYVKSSPYLMSFMSNYVQYKQIKTALNGRLASDVLNDKKSANYLYLNHNAINNYRKINFNNAKLDMLVEEMLGSADANNGAEKLLWIPASRPYYKVKKNSVFTKNKGYSKMLVFSAWEMVPKMIAGLVSYEFERRTVASLEKKLSYYSEKSRSKQRLTKDVEGIITYPSRYLANKYNVRQNIDQPIEAIRKSVKNAIAKDINELKNKGYTTVRMSALAVCNFLKAIDNNSNDIQIPNNCENLLANMAIASPAVCLLRTFRKNEKISDIASEFVSLFNTIESNNIIDSYYGTENEYYSNVIKYCVEGNLQAVIDEYSFVMGNGTEEKLDEMKEALISTSSIQYKLQNNIDDKNLRTHFAVGYNNTTTNDKTMIRSERVLKAFNSPFKPFVLASTSIGQEGLDFHKYCRKIMHWNLPHNPVDFEQREGRVNRYLCHAIRQNIANSKYGFSPFKKGVWDEMIERTRSGEKGNNSDLVPYWCLPQDFAETGIKYHIERFVPLYPYSKDIIKYEHLKEVLLLYRLTLGQPQQEDMIKKFTESGISDKKLKELCINLSPYDKLSDT